MTPDLDKLLELAKEASKRCPSPWKYDWGNWAVEVDNPRLLQHRDDVCIVTDLCQHFIDDEGNRCERSGAGDPNTGEYIAALSPDVVVALVEELKELRGDVEKYRKITGDTNLWRYDDDGKWKGPFDDSGKPCNWQTRLMELNKKVQDDICAKWKVKP